MITQFGRRTLAGATAVFSAAAIIDTARAQSAPESTFDRVRRTKTLRIAALPGELPYFKKDIVTGEWSGAAISMAKDIAKVFDAQLAYVESTYGNSVLDLQSNKVDLAFALNPTPTRALAIGFAHPMIVHPFGCLTRHDLNPKTWDDINKPELKVAFDIGSVHEVAARRFAPKSQLIGFKDRDQVVLALQSGRADVIVQAALIGLTTVGRNPSLGPYHLLSGPTVALPSNLAVQHEPDTRFVEVINAWLDFNRGIGQIREWILDGLELNGVPRNVVPSELSF
jgi:polar amino acid transport system substrate-binding protein